MSSLCVLHKEIRENIFTPKGFLWYVLTSIILSIMSYLFLTNRELSLLDRGHMLYMIINLIVALGALMGLAELLKSVFGIVDFEDHYSDSKQYVQQPLP